MESMSTAFYRMTTEEPIAARPENAEVAPPGGQSSLVRSR